MKLLFFEGRVAILQFFIKWAPTERFRSVEYFRTLPPSKLARTALQCGTSVYTLISGWVQFETNRIWRLISRLRLQNFLLDRLSEAKQTWHHNTFGAQLLWKVSDRKTHTTTTDDSLQGQQAGVRAARIFILNLFGSFRRLSALHLSLSLTLSLSFWVFRFAFETGAKNFFVCLIPPRRSWNLQLATKGRRNRHF